MEKRNLQQQQQQLLPTQRSSDGEALVLQARLVTVALADEPGADASR